MSWKDQIASLLPRYQPSTLPWLSVFEYSYYTINARTDSMLCVNAGRMSKSTTNNSALAFMHDTVWLHSEVIYI